MKAVFRLVVLLLMVTTARAQSVVIRAGHLVDPGSGTVSSDQKIAVEDGKIVDVAAWSEADAPAEYVDLSDRYVMPGLFDTHTHMCLTVDRRKDGGNYFVSTLLDPTPLRAIQGVANARDMLHAGFTTIRDIGNSGNYADTALRHAIESHLVPGPTMRNSGRIIAPFGGQFHLQPEKPGIGNPEYFFADTPGELVKAVRENIHFGATFIKIVVDDQQYIYTPEEIAVVIDEARRAGTYVAAHTWTEQGARNAVAAGVHSIEHGPDLPDDLLQQMKEKGIWLVGTEFTVDALRETFAGGDESELFKLHGQFVDRLRRAYKIGVPVAFGSDIVFRKEGEDRASLTLTTLESYREAGVSAADQLRALTVNAARMMGIDRERGLISVGLAADIIAMKENPMADTRALEAVDFVMKDGRVVNL